MLRRSKRSAQQNYPIPSKPVEYPVGSFLETEKGYFYIASADKRWRFTTKRCLDSWNPRLVQSSEAALKNYRIAAKMKFRNGSLIYSLADGKVYYISEGKRRHLTSPEAFEKVGGRFDRRNAVPVSLAEINLHPEGEPIT